jgi:prepilin-type N-terminal cleavage/methylation domain-containing protein
MHASRRTIRRAFTLIELVLVLVMIAAIMGMVVPQLSGFASGSRMRNTADQVVALTRLARSLAVTSGQIHVVRINNNGYCNVAVENDQQLIDLTNGMDTSFQLDSNVAVQLKDAQGQPKDYVEFYPNGRSQTGTFQVTLVNGQGLIEITCDAPVEGYRILHPEVQR